MLLNFKPSKVLMILSIDVDIYLDLRGKAARANITNSLLGSQTQAPKATYANDISMKMGISSTYCLCNTKK